MYSGYRLLINNNILICWNTFYRAGGTNIYFPIAYTSFVKIVTGNTGESAYDIMMNTIELSYFIPNNIQGHATGFSISIGS